MSEPTSNANPCVFVVADPDRVVELVAALSEPLPTTVVSKIEVVVSSGGDDTIDLFEEKKPFVVVLTAALETGDAGALVDALRSLVPRREDLGIVVVGDEPTSGAIRTAAEAAELAPDRFVTRPLAPRALRFAVASVVESVLGYRGVSARGTQPGFSPTRPPAVTQVDTGVPPSAARATPPPPPGRRSGPIEVVSGEPAKMSLRARWEALADSIIDLEQEGVDFVEEPERDELELDEVAEAAGGEGVRSLSAPVLIHPRQRAQSEHATPPRGTPTEPPERPSWREPAAPAREPTLIISDDAPSSAPRASAAANKVDTAPDKPPGDRWAEPMPLAELAGRDPSSPPSGDYRGDRSEDIALDDVGDFADDLKDDDLDPRDARPRPRLEVVPPPTDVPGTGEASGASDAPPLNDGRDFARQLRAKMSQMAQRLFQSGAGNNAPSSGPVDLGPRHDHHTEIDLASLGEETPLGDRGVTEFEGRAPSRPGDARDLVTSPGSWDTQVRERGLPDTGEIVRGVSDAAMLLSKMFAAGTTGRVQFRRTAGPGTEEVEKVVYFDQGRPVFASSNEHRDRMGGLLVREGKITAAQYERCQTVVAESGRRMGEILVDFGYLKRRELLPAVRRHVEDIVFSLFGWERGHYHIILDDEPSAERIRLSRHPASLILEGVRRKLDRTTLERLLGPTSTVIEVGDRDRLGGIINMGDLAAEERAALGAFDGHSDLTAVARAANVDIADVLPLAWGLVVLGLATARRTDSEIPDESTALVGETDLAIDRERVRARWQLVTEADYFALLGVRRDATGFEIRRAYQSARRDFATDAFPTDLRRELAQELDDIANVLDEAFRVLRDDRLRQTYLHNLIE